MSNSNKDQRMNSGERSSLLQFLNPQTSTLSSSEFIGTLPSIFSTNIGPTSQIGSILNQHRTSFQESFQTPQEGKKQQNFVRLPPLASAIPHVPTPVLAQLASPFYPINPQVYWNNESNSPPQLQKREVESVDVRAPTKRQKTTVQSTEGQERVARVPSNRKYFKILAEPYDQQRKSYANENRHILPKPLIICPIQEGTTKAEGTVSVRLVTENMKELDDTKGSILQGNTIQTLDPFQRAQFILKIMDTSEGGKFRLIFTITYQINGQSTLYEDVVISQPFKVTSNKKIVPEAPKVVGMKPEEINCKKVSEAWIKGKCFNENKNLKIQFGDTLAEIIEVEDNLITCMIPHMPNLTESKVVFVVVYATGPDGVEIPVSPQLAFTYIVDNSRR